MGLKIKKHMLDPHTFQETFDLLLKAEVPSTCFTVKGRNHLDDLLICICNHTGPREIKD